MDFCKPLPARASPTRTDRPHVPCSSLHCAGNTVLGFSRSCPGRSQSPPTSSMAHGQGRARDGGARLRSCWSSIRCLPTDRQLKPAGLHVACRYRHAQPREWHPSPRPSDSPRTLSSDVSGPHRARHVCGRYPTKVMYSDPSLREIYPHCGRGASGTGGRSVRGRRGDPQDGTTRSTWYCPVGHSMACRA